MEKITIESKLKELLMNDNDLLWQVVQGLNSWNGEFDDLQFYENDRYFFETFFSDTMEAVRATCFGDYDYTKDYVKFNAYGNLDTFDKWEIVEEIKSQIDEIVDSCIENYNHLDIFEINEIMWGVDEVDFSTLDEE